MKYKSNINFNGVEIVSKEVVDEVKIIFEEIDMYKDHSTAYVHGNYTYSDLVIKLDKLEAEKISQIIKENINNTYSLNNDSYDGFNSNKLKIDYTRDDKVWYINGYVKSYDIFDMYKKSETHFITVQILNAKQDNLGD